jgi:predicted phage terminase large subunit-like protein
VQDATIAACTPRINRYIPIRPTTKQGAYLLLEDRLEVFYGGAAAGAKTTAILAAALQFVDVPGYHALLARRNYKQLSQPGCWIPRSHEWLDGTDARWLEGQKRWTFPSGATVTFGFVGQQAEDWRKYESAEFAFIGIDEVTAWEEQDYRNLFSRLRRPVSVKVPLRMRCASNPGGRGHEWVKRRFVDPKTRLDRAVFLRAFLTDNPHIDYDEYVASLQETHPTTWRRLLYGDWDTADPGEMFQPRVWLDESNFLDEAPPRSDVVRRVRYWDLAAAEPTSSNPDPDYTAGARWSRLADGRYVLEHLVRVRKTPGATERIVASTAQTDGSRTTQYVEQVPGAGAALVDHYRRNVCPEGIRMRGDPVRGKKGERARPLAAEMEKGKILIVRGDWNEALFDEMEAFSEDPAHSGAHDDQVDACTGGFAQIRKKGMMSGATATSVTLPAVGSYR